ncbi:MAG: 16S rRNA (guanine(966)-N(2))-methyltransferase RsmD [Legionellales bacterium]|jgi:16S rRNA (guanine966-N2)-methyltransferase
MSNKIRIIAGSLRSRLIKVPDDIVRPTPNRIRETLFNWLREDITGANCLDLFSGSGALGFEAISRGARHVTFLEKDTHIIRNLKQNSEDLKISNAAFAKTDALTWLKKTESEKFDIIFLDPPYAENLIIPCLKLLVEHQLLAPDAKIYIEHNQPLDEMIFPENLQLIKNLKAGKVFYGLLIISSAIPAKQ